ncbi:lysoplasmalogenase [Rhodococcus spelaei]|uniref:Lysoplasmalogenase n=1 Tax=Rhodococcus spelaei TaxID=2546320 RepID=A0A541B7Y4_9NOCA|nr:lysoplasmalogenase [Rhodococcus spelaei]TQF68436.1 lysoplasmalogenase [Rhodococcus spelaei]
MIADATRTLGRQAVTALTAFAAVSVIHLAAQLVDADGVANVTQWFLMPLLAGFLALATATPRTRLVRLTLLALGLSWLGDTAPDLADGDTAFLVMIGFFLLAQLAYIAAFWPYRAASVLRRPAAAGYVAVIVALVAACAPGAGTLLAPALVYGFCLGTMAVLSTALGRVAAVGGALFLLSDSMIALGAFADWFHPPVEGFWVMLTYIAGQVLIVLGVLAVVRSTAGTPETATTSSAR